MEWKSSYNRATFFLGVFGLVAGVVIGVASIRESWKIARESGSLERPSIVFGFSDARAPGPNAEVIALIPEECSAKPVLMELPLTIHNQGAKGAADVQAMLSLPLIDGRSFATKADLSDAMTSDASPSLTAVRRTVEDTSKRRTVTYTIEKLYPGMSVTVGEPLEAPLPLAIPAGDIIDGATSGELRVTYSVQIPLLITHDQTQLTTASIDLSVIRAASFEAARPQLKKYIETKLKKLPAVSGWDGFVRAWIIRPRGEIIVLAPAQLACGDKRGSFVFTRNAKILEYEVYRPRLAWPGA